MTNLSFSFIGKTCITVPLWQDRKQPFLSALILIWNSLPDTTVGHTMTPDHINDNYLLYYY